MGLKLWVKPLDFHFEVLQKRQATYNSSYCLQGWTNKIPYDYNQNEKVY